jgi:putative two-component system hydrogenase maturation factor HypX/HoxX
VKAAVVADGGAVAGGSDAAAPGTIIARRHGAVLVRAGNSGSVWIGPAKPIAVGGRKTIRLPAAEVLSARLDGLSVPDRSALFDGGLEGSACGASSFQEIAYRRHGSIGRLTFDFYNGAMSTARCRRLFIALRYAIEQDTAALVVEGGSVFSNGIALNTVEAAANPALEARRNINAINDVCREVVDCGRQPLVAAISGNAGAAGVMLALGAHRVVLPAWCSIRITRRWDCTARSTGPIPSRAGSAVAYSCHGGFSLRGCPTLGGPPRRG